MILGRAILSERKLFSPAIKLREMEARTKDILP